MKMPRTANRFGLLPAFMAGLLLCGCASMSTEEKLVIGVMAADLATTSYALDHGARELNPLIRGHSNAETVLKGVAINALLYWLQKRATRNDSLEGQKRYWRIVLGFRAPIVGWNLSQIQRRL